MDEPGTRESVWEFEFGSSRVLVRPDLHNVYILNPTAAFAWQLLCAGKGHTEAAPEYAEHFEVPLEVAAHDIQSTWTEWERSLLAPSSPTPSIAPPNLPDPGSGIFSCTYLLHGRKIRVALHDSDLIAEITPRLQPLTTVESAESDAAVQAIASSNGYHIFSNSSCIATEQHAADARVVFLQELTRAATNGEWTAILHAGACGSGSKCVIFPAESHSGKSTLAAVLMASGLSLYADDSVALERDTLKVPAMPFSLMMREGSWPVLSKRISVVDALPIHNRYGERVKFLQPVTPAHPSSASAAAIVFSRWQRGTATSVKTLDSFDALARLQASGFWMAPSRECIQAFLNWLRALPIYELVYSDADAACSFIQAMIDE